MSAHPDPAEAWAPPATPIGTPLYLHVPFCERKCNYCDFYSRPAEDEELDAFIDTLLAEATLRAPTRPATVFLGGGTPSLLSARQLERLLSRLDEITGFRASAREVTIECNPESLQLEKARVLRDLGATRLSVGIQSFQDDLLRAFGRPHRASEGKKALQVAIDAGFTSVSADMIFAAPDQTLASWEQDLTELAGSGVQHISAYGLTFEEGTPFKQRLDRGELHRVGEEEDLAFFRSTRAWLPALGFAAYEISNYSLFGYQCDHNINYWRNGEYLGLGPSAVSRLGPSRFGNARSIHRWRTATEGGAPAPEWEESLSPVRRLGETWWLGLRLSDGVNPAEARSTARVPRESGSLPASDPAEQLAGELADDGWLVRRGDRWSLTERGLPLADALAARFLAVCADR
jgi:oxygen-independent coproporphyrinogen III oxidase